MIVYIEGREIIIQEPIPSTLKKYGLSLHEWSEILCQQDYKCPICKRYLVKKTNIDHHHVQGWRRMKPEKRKLYVRGVTCWYCNKHVISAITLDKARNATVYLEAFEKRRPNAKEAQNKSE